MTEQQTRPPRNPDARSRLFELILSMDPQDAPAPAVLERLLDQALAEEAAEARDAALREQTRITVEGLAWAIHEEQAERQGGCGNHTESYDDHMDFHRGVAERIVAALPRTPGENR